MPIRFSQELSGWRAQLELSGERITDTCQRLRLLPQGGTAVGTGVNAASNFAKAICDTIVRAYRKAVAMAADQVTGNDTTITVAGHNQGIFNSMLCCRLSPTTCYKASSY